MQKQNLIETFKMEGFVIEKIINYEDKIEILCHVKGAGIWLKDKYYRKVTEIKTRKISHMMQENRVVVLVVKQRRFYVGQGKKLWEAIPKVQGKAQTSLEFQKNTLRELQRDNYKGTGNKRNRSGMFAMKLLDGIDFLINWNTEITKIGLDGKYVRGKELVHHVANLNLNKSVTVLPNLSQFELKKNF
jgi:hypothetical protein